MTPKRPPPATVFDVAFGCVLVVVAFWLRLAVARAFTAEPVWDGHYYDFGAKRIAEGLGYSDDGPLDGIKSWHPWCHYPVGYSAFLSAFYKLFGSGREITRAVNAIVGAALAPVTWLVARFALSPPRARAAGILVALYPGLILYSALVMSEELAALTTMLSFFITLRDPKPRRGVILGALALGVSALVRPQALLCAPFLLFVLHERWPGLKTAFLHTAAVCAIALVPVLPWTARNCKVMDSCTLVSTNGGWNLAIGAFPRATGRFETLHSSDGCSEVTGQVQQDRCWFEYGLNEIARHPAHFLALVPKKLGYTFDHESFAVGYLHEARPEQWPDERAKKTRALLTLGLQLLIVFGTLGAIAFPGIRRPYLRTQAALVVAWALASTVLLSLDEPHVWPLVIALSVIPFVPHLRGAPLFSPAQKLLAGLVLTTVLTHAVFFGEDRYHVVTVPVFCIFLAGALRKGQRQNEKGALPEKRRPVSNAS